MFDLPAVLNPRDWLNSTLLGEPLNWLIVAVIASIWLLLFHVVMTGFSSMQAGKDAAIGSTAPGQVAALSPSAAAFALPGVLASGQATVPPNFVGGATTIWTDGSEAKFAEDGWIANP